MLKDMKGCSGVGRPGPGLSGVEGRTKYEDDLSVVVVVRGALPDCIQGMWADFTLDTGTVRSGGLIFCE